MKTRESGMPNEDMWSSFFDAPTVLAAVGLTPDCHDAVEFGCGYGTFTIPAARLVRATVYALDIETEMIETTTAKAHAAGLSNVVTILRDFVNDGTGLPDFSVDYAMLFNILHCEAPKILFNEARRVLRPEGRLGIIHWNHDPTTPRGPSMSIRPRPEQCLAWAEQAGFFLLPPGIIDLPPHHYGMALTCNQKKR